MTVIGLGADLVDVDRFRTTIDRTPGVVTRLFTGAEQAYAGERRDPAQRLAARFAAKEAVLKALGLGLGAMRFRDIEVVRAESGQPSIVLHGTAADSAIEHGVELLQVTLSHTDQVAQAVVLAMGTGARP